MKVGFTGTRTGMTDPQIEAFSGVISKLHVTEFHHGDCVGADRDAHTVINHLFSDVLIIGHPPLEQKLRAFCKGFHEMRPEQSYLDRNKAIVDETETLIAIPSTKKSQVRSGTWSTVRYATGRKDRRVIIIYPDGTLNQSVY